MGRHIHLGEEEKIAANRVIVSDQQTNRRKNINLLTISDVKRLLSCYSY